MFSEAIRSRLNLAVNGHPIFSKVSMSSFALPITSNHIPGDPFRFTSNLEKVRGNLC